MVFLSIRLFISIYYLFSFIGYSCLSTIPSGAGALSTLYITTSCHLNIGFTFHGKFPLYSLHQGPKDIWEHPIYCGLNGSQCCGKTCLQHLPANLVPACGPKLSLILKHLPLTEAVKTIFEGTGECAAVNWSFLGFSMPQWTLAFFMVFAIVIIWQALRKTK
jgi:hypothetical protein